MLSSPIGKAVIGEVGVKMTSHSLKALMKEFDIKVYTIRGNHDDPDFFKDDDSEMSTLLGKTYPKIHFLADALVRQIPVLNDAVAHRIGNAHHIPDV